MSCNFLEKPLVLRGMVELPLPLEVISRPGVGMGGRMDTRPLAEERGGCRLNFNETCYSDGMI